MKKSLYAILGVEPTATLDELRAAFDTLLAQASDTDTARRVALKEAWSVLGHPQRRAAYDAALHVGSALPGMRSVARAPAEAEPTHRRVWGLGLGMLVVALVVVGWRARPNPPAPAKPTETTVISGGQAVLLPPPAPVPEALPPATPERAVSLSAQALFEKASASVMRVLVHDYNGQPVAQGSGVVIDRNTVITNCHVTEKGSIIRLKHQDDTYDASVVVADSYHDLCKLSVPGLRAPAVPLGKVASLKVGQKVFAIGSPQGLDLTLSDGMVSSLRQTDDGTIVQTTAPISPGSSGGGLFNEFGELVGIVTFQYRGGQNLNFAIPADWITTMRPTRAPER